MNWSALDWGILGPAFIAGLLVLATHVPLGALSPALDYTVAVELCGAADWSVWDSLQVDVNDKFNAYIGVDNIADRLPQFTHSSAKAAPATPASAVGPAAPLEHHHGRCLCGAVDLMVNGRLRDISQCHCEQCRRWHGHRLQRLRRLPDQYPGNVIQAALRHQF